jgi:CDP-diacylglycerol pyrophosphatase
MRSFRLRELLIGSLACCWVSNADAEQSNALWRIVHGLCVTDKKVSGSPAPCMAVNLAQGWAVVRNPRGATEVLLVPTARVSGIESPRLLAPEAPNYWQFAWEARRYFERRVGHSVARDETGMAINSVQGRSQDQLHIHIDCIDQSVIQELRAREYGIKPRWTTLSFDLVGHRYHALWIDESDLADQDPFRLLADREAKKGQGLQRQSLAVLGMNRSDGSRGFVVLSAQSGESGNPVAVAEELLDHSCLVLKPASPARQTGG